MPVTLALLALAACVRTRPPDPDLGAGPSSDVPTADTDTHTGVEPSGEPVRVDIPPSVVVHGLPLMKFAHNVGIVPSYAGESSTLFLNSLEDGIFPEWPDTFLIDGDIPRGEHQILDLWDGVSSSSVGQDGPVVVAGDVNADGHLDAWIGAQLFHGPFRGRKLVYGGGVAVLEDHSGAWDGNFDANGDGHLDVLTTVGLMQGFVYYGPFSGSIPKRLGERPTYSQLGMGICPNSSLHAVVLRDALGPGHHAAAVGQGAMGGAGDCTPVAEVFDLMVPPGTVVKDKDRLSEAYPGGARPFDSVGDLDGDGFGDAVFGDQQGSWLLPGPLDQVKNLTEGPLVFTLLNGDVVSGLGDINGDGIEELLGNRTDWHGPGSATTTWVILFSPFADPLDIHAGLHFGPYFGPGSLGNAWDISAADLDGDGLSDVVSNYPLNGWYDNIGSLRIWYGADLLAAYEASLSLTP